MYRAKMRSNPIARLAERYARRNEPNAFTCAECDREIEAGEGFDWRQRACSSECSELIYSASII